MATDDERREIARRLRDRLKTDGIGGFTSGEFGNAVYFSVMHGHRGGYGEAGSFLADLIEPSEPKFMCVTEVKIDGERLEKLVHDAAVELTGIDCDALLALADELDKDADNIISAARNARFTGGGPRMGEAKHDACEWRCIARRIREALGVES